MKNFVLTASEIKQLSESCRKEVDSLISQREVALNTLKERIKKLNFQYAYCRPDNGTIENEGSADNLTLKTLIKTHGEQWGNGYGWDYEVKIGRKFITVNGYFSGTDRAAKEIKFQVTPEWLDKQISLLEEIHDEVDKEPLVLSVVEAFEMKRSEMEEYQFSY